MQYLQLRMFGGMSVPEFQPFVSPDENRPEFTFRALLLGSIFRHHLWRRHGLCGPARRAYCGRLDSDRGAVDQHSARLWPGLHP